MAAWRFYVYEIVEGGRCYYIGKGSGRRLQNQIRAFGKLGHEIARFKKEEDAYSFEKHLIAQRKPAANFLKGGNGNRATKKYYRRTKEEILMEKIGTRKYAAMYLYINRYQIEKYGFDMSKIEDIRRVAYG